MNDILRRLAGGDRRSIGRSNAVVRRVLSDRSALAAIIAELSSEDAVVRMRCADVAEKVSAVHPGWLQPHKKHLLALAARVEQQELRWHLAQMLPRLTLTARERHRATELLYAYLNDGSRIVKACVMEALACFAQNDARLHAQLISLFAGFRRTESPAVQARARKLLARLPWRDSCDQSALAC
jgi:hypothetical protein